MELANLHVQSLRASVAQNPKLDRSARSDLGYGNLQCATVLDLFPIQRINHVATLQSTTAGRRIRRPLRGNCSRCRLQVEEAGIGRRYILQADAEVAMMHCSSLDQLLRRRPHQLRRNSEPRTRERSAVRDDERIDPNQLTMRIHQ